MQVIWQDSRMANELISLTFGIMTDDDDCSYTSANVRNGVMKDLICYRFLRKSLVENFNRIKVREVIGIIGSR